MVVQQPGHPRPRLSVLVIGYRMAAQLANTLYTFSTAYQRGVAAADYEVVVVENTSADNYDESQLAELPGQFRFFRRDEPGVSPVPAINFGLSQCRGDTVGLLIDGARMVSPGVIRCALEAAELYPRALTVTPGYQLGDKPQHLSALEGYDEARERELLNSVRWREDGYELFRISSISGANPNGYLQPIMECNCLFAPASAFEAIGGADARFDMRGGGAINLHMYRKLGLLPDTRVVVLPGEGSFHQYHGGVTTSTAYDVEREREQHSRQLQTLWGQQFHSLRKEPVLLGAVAAQAQPWLEYSSKMAQKRFQRLTRQGIPFWQDDEPPTMAQDVS